MIIWCSETADNGSSPSWSCLLHCCPCPSLRGALVVAFPQSQAVHLQTQPGTALHQEHCTWCSAVPCQATILAECCLPLFRGTTAPAEPISQKRRSQQQAAQAWHVQLACDLFDGAGGGGLAAEDFPALPGVPVFPEMFVYFLLTAWKGSTSSMVHRAGSGFRAAEDFPTLFQVCLCYFFENSLL